MSVKTISKELRRETRPLKDYFGLLSKEIGKNMLKDLEKIKKANIASHRVKLISLIPSER